MQYSIIHLARKGKMLDNDQWKRILVISIKYTGTESHFWDRDHNTRGRDHSLGIGITAYSYGITVFGSGSWQRNNFNMENMESWRENDN